MPVSNIQLQANITGFPINIKFDYRLNVRKDFVFLRYAPQFAGDEAGVSFLDYNAINPFDNIVILDKTESIPENSPIIAQEEIQLTKVFISTKGKFLITDIFITDSEGLEKPQYFKHNLSGLPISITDVEVLDSEFNPVPTDQYVYYDESTVLGYDSRTVYTNLRSEFDILRNEFNVYYVRYKALATSETVVELLNPKPVYEETLFTTTPTVRAYSIQEEYGHNEITVHFDSRNFSPSSVGSLRVAVKSTAADRIYVEHPTFALPNKKWNLRISDGQFFKNLAGEVESETIGTGDDLEVLFNLNKPIVNPLSLVITAGGVDQVLDTDYQLNKQAGPDNTDQIEFFVAPTLGDDIVASFTYDAQVGKYYIPEWNEQIFSPIQPYKFLSELRTFVLEERLLYVEPNPISNLEIQGFYLYIIQRDASGTPVRAVTNDPDADLYITPLGNASDIFFSVDAIQSISENDGFIRLNTDIDPDLDTVVTYRYKEEWLTYRDIEMNPALNPTVRDRKVAVYIKPEISRIKLTGQVVQTIDRAVHHLVLDSTDNIFESSEDEAFQSIESISTSGGSDYLVDPALGAVDIYTGYELEIITGDNSGRRLKIIGYNPGTNELSVGFPFAQNIIAGIRYRINKKFDSYSVLDPDTSTIFDYIGWKEKLTSYPYFYIILADVKAINLLGIADLSLQDIRIRGGGINDQYQDLAINAQRESNWFYDIGYWDGRPFPGMAALVVELPRTILEERGGPFNKEQVLEIVHRHIADGYYPIIRYYDRSTKILNMVPGNQTLLVEWLDVMADEYNIYYGNSPEVLDQVVNVAGTETSYELTGLENNKTYFVRVEAVINDIPSYPSRIAMAVPFDLSEVKGPATYGVTLYGDGVYST